LTESAELDEVQSVQSEEKRSIQLRGEAFNLTNHLNAGPPVLTTNSGTFGKIQSDISGTSGLTTGDQRIIQLGLKLVF
jgi:hypothetical protein